MFTDDALKEETMVWPISFILILSVLLTGSVLCFDYINIPMQFNASYTPIKKTVLGYDVILFLN